MNATLVALILMFSICLVVGTKNNMCKVQYVKENPRVICENVVSLRAIRSYLVLNLKSKPVAQLLFYCIMTKKLSLSRKIFFDLKISEISMSCPFESIRDNALTHTRSLTKLHLYQTEFCRIPNAISRIKSLTTLEIVDGRLIEITTELQYMPGLANLSLAQNRISSLLGNAFLGDVKLQSIILTSNKLSRLDNKTFDPCPSLRLVRLDKNNLITVDGLFQNPSLMNIDLGCNLLKTIPEDLFYNLENVTSVNLKRNYIRNVTKWFSGSNRLEHIDLSINLIESCDYAFQSMQSLKTINLHDNRLSKITKNCFSSIPSVVELILSQNFISQIDSKALSQLDRLQSFDVSLNGLKILSRESFPEVLKIQELFAYGNYWVCDCRLLWLRDWMANTTLNTSNFDFSCSLPIRFKSKQLSQLTKEDLSWPKEDCPLYCDCSCVAYRDEGYANVNCASKRLTKIPTGFPELTIELNLQENLLSNPVEINLPSTSKLRILNLERNFISRLDFNLPNNIEVLLLAENNITRFFNIPPSNVKTFTLSRNPWQCDCNTLPFRKWIIAHNSEFNIYKK
ncbi:slit homolog 2 protein-like [Parasteatoda tepidariorum]|uniref:slit homolog 2 protein-like n=1 Tax=Parasteatoda tepidariorum TaxID=114398 RepID=UPI0039BD1062